MTNNTIAVANFGKTLAAATLDDLVRVKTSDYVFLLLDCSSSMNSKMRNGKKRIAGLRDVVKEITAQRAVQMVAFGPSNDEGRVVFFCGAVPAPAGGTPLHAALEFAKEQNAGRVVVVSDGCPDSPQAAMDAAKAFGGQVDVVFVGNPGDYGSNFLAELAAITGGTAFDGDLSEPKTLGGAVIGLLDGEVEAPAAAFANGDGEDDDEDDEEADDEAEEDGDDQDDDE